MPSLDLATVRYAVVFLLALIVSVTFHEFGHAYVADKLGDRLPRQQGRVTLNPLAHADPLGTIAFPLAGILFFGGVLFGWGRPVQTSPVSYSRRFTMRTGHLMVAAAGPLMNVVLAVAVSILYVALSRTGVVSLAGPLAGGIEMLIHLNFILAAFNLLPVPPLDGGTVLAGLLPYRHQHVVAFLQQWGMMILFALLFTGVIGLLLRPVNALYVVWIDALRSLA